MTPKIQTVTRVEKRTTLRLSADDIIRLVNRERIELGQPLILTRPTVTIMVPGGGDWSNTELDVDTRHPVEITWTEVSEEGEAE